MTSFSADKKLYHHRNLEYLYRKTLRYFHSFECIKSHDATSNVTKPVRINMCKKLHSTRDCAAWITFILIRCVGKVETLHKCGFVYARAITALN